IFNKLGEYKMKKLVLLLTTLSIIFPATTTVLSCGSKPQHSGLNYFDDRTSQEIEIQKDIDNEISSTTFDTNKKVILVGLDGIIKENFDQYIRPDNNDEEGFEYDYNTQNYESVGG